MLSRDHGRASRSGAAASWGAWLAAVTLGAALLAVAGCGGAEPKPPPSAQEPAMAPGEEGAAMAKSPEMAGPAETPPQPGAPSQAARPAPPREQAPAALEPEPQPPVTEETIPEFRYLEEVDQQPPVTEPAPGAPPNQLAMAAPAPGVAPDGTVRVAVLHRQGQEQAAIGVATVIDKFQNARLSQALGKPVRVAYISRVNQEATRPENLVRYRVGMLKAALQLAAVLPGNQVAEPMTPEEAARSSVDLVIYLGANVR